MLPWSHDYPWPHSPDRDDCLHDPQLSVLVALLAVAVTLVFATWFAASGPTNAPHAAPAPSPNALVSPTPPPPDLMYDVRLALELMDHQA